MADAEEPVSDRTVQDSRLNQSSASGEFADLLPDTFDAWLENLRPPLKLAQNTEPAGLPIDPAPPAGELKFEGTLRIDCYVTGRLRSLTGTLIVSETAEVESDVFVANAIIDGIMHGDIYASERVELQAHAKVFGDIETPALVVQTGARLEGQCRFLPSPSSSAGGESDQPREANG
jgi:cytoskeletal protein CcmA (bactofilin family)